MKKPSFLLFAVLLLPFTLTGCFKTITIADIAPDQLNSPVSGVVIGSWNAGSLVVYSQDQNGVLETEEIQVHRDSGVDNTVKLVNAASSAAQAVGTVMIGVGTRSHGEAWQRISREGIDVNHSGIPGANINLNNASNSTSNSISSANANASASASARAGFQGD
ncbi:MAG: hypothetical protein ACI8UO_001569 [Verrucomicrobiales bacterium]|jgi:hypothetical protein